MVKLASQFLHLPVSVTLNRGRGAIEGVITALDPLNGSIELTDAVIRLTGAPARAGGVQLINRSDVAGLALLSVNKSQSPSQLSAAPAQPAPSVVLQQVASGGACSDYDSPTYDSVPAPVKPKKVRGKKVSKAKARNVGFHDGSEADESDRSGRFQLPGAAARSFDEDFDFSAGLDSFDKKKVFAHIKSQDETDPSHRLVAHNRLPASMRKLAPNESVLSASELVAQRIESLQLSNGGSRAESADEVTEDESVYEEAIGGLSEPVPAPAPVPAPQQRRRTSSKRGSHALFNVEGVKAASVNLRQLKEAMSIADIESGPTPVQRYEHAGRGLASLMLSMPRTTKGGRTSVCILCDDCEKGQIALRAGTFLANRACKVVAYILSTSNHGEGFRTNLRMFSSAGGRIVRSLAELEKVYDVVVDAIADCDVQGALEPKSAEDLAAAEWATKSGLPLLSIDAPLGIDHDSGTPTTSSPLKPDYLACVGAVRPNAVLADPDTTVVLLDVGVPPALWQRVGVHDWERDTFGLDFVVWLNRG